VCSSDLNWTLVTSTNLQVPQPLGITVDTSIMEPFGEPDNVFLRAEYDKLDGTTGVQEFGPFSPRFSTWTRWILNPDNFSPNGVLNFYFRRTEDCCVISTGQLQVYVTTVNDALLEFPRPTFRHPWEYYDYLREWSLWVTRAPYYHAYNSMSHAHTLLDFSISWISAPNTEGALLTLQWDVTSHALQWFLEDAYAAFANPAYTVEAATGSGYRVVLYDSTDYNSLDAASPEYIYSHSIACEPYDTTPCGAFVPPVAPIYVQAPVLDDDYLASAVGDRVTLTSDTLGFMDSRIGSLEIRGAKVTLYANPNRTGAQATYLSDTSDLGGFAEWARSIMIEPPTVFYLAGLIWYDHDRDGEIDVDEPPLPSVKLYALYDANNDGNLVLPPGGYAQADSKGNFTFTQLFAGSYRLGVDLGTLPPGLVPTSDPDGVKTPNTADIILLPNTSVTEQNFGYWYPDSPLYLPVISR
jgi:hypothetical protein